MTPETVNSELVDSGESFTDKKRQFIISRSRYIYARERIVEVLLLLCALVSVFTTVGIIMVLSIQAFEFFKEVSIWDFLTDTQWTPLFADKHFGILPLLS
ncbi:MAG: hypothetical protein LH473_09245, partial [Chitinophagales bacterium]|nr:hypothetical protein [Chitinophagales bacterium]